MLEIKIKKGELFDEIRKIFIYTEDVTIHLEHSLVSLSKWEQKWHKPFMSKTEEKTTEEMLDYIRCMTLDKNVNPDSYYFLTSKDFMRIKEYIEDPMTATTIREDPNSPKNNRPITNELIYYWMISYNIPVEFQKWHINRLMTLIRVCNAETEPRKKMSTTELMARNTKLNAERKAKFQSKG